MLVASFTNVVRHARGSLIRSMSSVPETMKVCTSKEGVMSLSHNGVCVTQLEEKTQQTTMCLF